jgi:ABC-2 type transport system permease protein
MLRFWMPVATLWYRELLRFWRQRSRVLGVVASPLVFWLIIGSGFGDLSRFFAGALVLTVLFSAIFSTMSIIEDRREGFLLSMLVSPAPRTSMVLGKLLGSSTLAWIQGLIFLAFAPLAGLHPDAASVVGIAGTIFLVSFALSALGFVIAWRMNSMQGFHAIMNLFLIPMWMVSGAVFPIWEAHTWIRWVMLANPLTYSVAAMTRQLAAKVGPGTPALSTGLIVTAVFGIVLLFFSAAMARRTAKTSSA